MVDVDGVEREIDILVMATGFQPTNYLARIEIVGRGGRTLREYWNGEPRAFLGITVPEFPNFFILYGPGTNGGEIVSLLQRQSEYAVRCDEADDARGRHRDRSEAAVGRASTTRGSSRRWKARRGR